MSPRLPSPRTAVRAAALALAVAGCGAGETPPEAAGAPPPSVTVARVSRSQLVDQRERVGQVRAVQDVELRARVEGFLEERSFEEGSDVEKGQQLFVIERAPYEAAELRAEAELARAKSQLQEAEVELRRTRSLRERQVVSQAQEDAAVTSAGAAAADVLAAEAALKEAQLDLEYTVIRSPLAGRIGDTAYDVGDLVGPDSGTLASVASLDPIHVYWQVPEQVLLDFRRANARRRARGEEPIRVTARLRFADGSLYEHEGVWDFLDNRVDPTTGTQTARAVFPNPDALLLPGQYATVLVQVGEPRRALVIPQSAVQEDQAGRFVLVVDEDDVAHIRRVALGAQDGIYWEVREGLGEGERVIYQGVQKARPGARVAPVEMEPGAADRAARGAGRGAAPDATRSEPDAAPAEPDAARSEPDAAPAEPDAAPPAPPER